MFENRQRAGTDLAERLAAEGVQPDRVVGVLEGGIVVAAAVADHLEVPLTAAAAEKVPCPGETELAAGAVAADGTNWRNDRLIERRDIPEPYVEQELDEARVRAQDHVDQYGLDEQPDYDGETIVLVDDGIETGSTAIACLRSLRRAGAGKICLAVPIAPEASLVDIRGELECDEAVALETPSAVGPLGDHYESYQSVDEERVADLLDRA